MTVLCATLRVHWYLRVTVITRQRIGVPLLRASLAEGASQLVVIPDESRVDLSAEIPRQVGHRAAIKVPPGPRAPIYDHKLARLSLQAAGGHSPGILLEETP